MLTLFILPIPSIQVKLFQMSDIMCKISFQNGHNSGFVRIPWAASDPFGDMCINGTLQYYNVHKLEMCNARNALHFRNDDPL